MSADAHRVQKRVSGALDLELQPTEGPDRMLGTELWSSKRAEGALTL